MAIKKKISTVTKKDIKTLSASEGSIPDDNVKDATESCEGENQNLWPVDVADATTLEKFIRLVRTEFNIGKAFILTEFGNNKSCTAQFISKNYKVTIEVKNKEVFEDD